MAKSFPELKDIFLDEMLEVENSELMAYTEINLIPSTWKYVNTKYRTRQIKVKKNTKLLNYHLLKKLEMVSNPHQFITL